MGLGGLTQLARQIKELNWDVEIFGSFFFSSSDVREAAGGIETLEGIRFVDAPGVSTEQGKKFIEEFKKRRAEVQSDFLVTASYDLMRLIAQAWKAGNNTSSLVRDYLYQLPSYPGLTGEVSFDSNGDVLGISYVVKKIEKERIITLP